MFSRGGTQQRRKYSDDYHSVYRRSGTHQASAVVVTEYHATATAALCATPPPSEPRLPPQPTGCCSHPTTGSHSRPPRAAASITTTVQNRPPTIALDPLRPIAPAFVCWYLLTTASGAPTVSTGRRPKAPLSAVKYFSFNGNVVPTQLRLMSASLDGPSAVICRFGLFPCNSDSLP